MHIMSYENNGTKIVQNCTDINDRKIYKGGTLVFSSRTDLNIYYCQVLTELSLLTRNPKDRELFKQVSGKLEFLRGITRDLAMGAPYTVILEDIDVVLVANHTILGVTLNYAPMRLREMKEKFENKAGIKCLEFQSVEHLFERRVWTKFKAEAIDEYQYMPWLYLDGLNNAFCGSYEYLLEELQPEELKKKWWHQCVY